MEKIDLVYVIDDDPLYIFSMKKLLKLSDFCNEALFFKNGQEALEKFQSNIAQNDPLPDLLFLDISMPLMNGWQFLDQLVGLPINKEIKIFIVSSSIDPSDMDKSKSYNIVTDYIYKPITINKMIELKEHLLA